MSSGTWDMVNSEILARNEETHKIPEIPISVDLRPISLVSRIRGGATNQKHRTFHIFGQLKSWERSAHTHKTREFQRSGDPEISDQPPQQTSRGVYTDLKGKVVSIGDKVRLLTGTKTGYNGDLGEIVHFTKRYIKVKLVSKRVRSRLGKNLE